MTNLHNKVLFITGASRGIGEAIALRAAKDGAKIVIAAKTTEPHPTLPGTIYTVAQEVEKLGGQALPIALDIRDEEGIQAAINKTIETFGQLDILVNNASAISLTPTSKTSMKKFDLMFSVNVRGTYACSQAALPHLMNAENAHILNLAPPLNMHPKWFKNHVAYTMSKYGMSMCTLGMSEEFRPHGIAVNSLWPQTAIATMAMYVVAGEAVYQTCRSPQIVADAAHAILTQDSRETTGNFFTDESVLRNMGQTQFEQYALDPTKTPPKDYFLD